jgi:hypothetical protein
LFIAVGIHSLYVGFIYSVDAVDQLKSSGPNHNLTMGKNV